MSSNFTNAFLPCVEIALIKYGTSRLFCSMKTDSIDEKSSGASSSSITVTSPFKPWGFRIHPILKQESISINKNANAVCALASNRILSKLSLGFLRFRCRSFSFRRLWRSSSSFNYLRFLTDCFSTCFADLCFSLLASFCAGFLRLRKLITFGFNCSRLGLKPIL